MTPSDTKKLAFEKARQSALEKFGVHVRSEQTLTRVETPDAVREMSTSRIAVLAAGNASLVEGSKEVSRRPIEATMIYKVSADFRIEPTDFAETLRAYQRVGTDSRLKRTVATAAEVQNELTQVEAANAEAPEVRRLLSQAEDSYDAISAAVREMDGSSLRSEVSKKRRRRQNALLRYMQTVKKHGYPGDLLELTIRKADMRDEGNEIQFTYEAGYHWTGSRSEVTASCRETRPTWWPDEEGQISRGWDGWIDQIFDPQSPFSMKLPVALYFLGENDNVLLLVDRTSGGMMGSPEMQFWLR
jgi:hypothetical protein